MSEVPAGLHLDAVQRPPPRPTVTVTLTRDGPNGLEVLLGLRVSTMKAFPDTWAFPGGGVSRRDVVGMEAASLSRLDDGDDLARFAACREMAEELGWVWDGGALKEVPTDVRRRLLEEREAWNDVVQDHLAVDPTALQVISRRTTPPFGPMQFENTFLHLHLGDAALTPPLDLEPQTEFERMVWNTVDEHLRAWRSHERRIAPPVASLLMHLEGLLDEHNGDGGAAMTTLAQRRPGREAIHFAHGVQVHPVPTATLPPADHTNAYLIGPVGGPTVIVDPALRHREDMEVLADVMDRRGGTVMAVVYTHGHGDHLGDEGLLREAFDAPIWGHRLGGMRVDRALEDGEVIDLDGDRWTVLHTPGHHPGHLCLHGAAGLVAGDMVAGVGTILIPSAEGDMQAYLEQLERLRALQPHLIFPSHGPVITTPDAVLSHYLRHRRARHERVLEAVRSGHHVAMEIATFAYADSPDAHPGLALDQTRSHLTSLVAEGKVVERDTGWHLP
jgi:ribonuclease/clavin/mitogillin